MVKNIMLTAQILMMFPMTRILSGAVDILGSHPYSGTDRVQKAIEPVEVLEGTLEKVKIINRYDHVTLDRLNLSAS